MFQQIESRLESFIRDEAANVTVEWVVVVASVVAFGVLVMASISGGVVVFSEGAKEELAARDVGGSV